MGGRPVHEQCDRVVRFEAPNDFHCGERVVAQRQCFDSPASASGLTQIGQFRLRFSHGDDLQLNAALSEQRSAKFPVAEVHRHKEHSFCARLRGFEVFPAHESVEEIINGEATLVSPKVRQLDGKLVKQLAGSDVSGMTVPVNCWQHILENDAASGGTSQPIDFCQMTGEAAEEEMRHSPGDGDCNAPQPCAIE